MTEKRQTSLKCSGEWVAPANVAVLVADEIEITQGSTMNLGAGLREITTSRLVMHPGSTLKADGMPKGFKLRSKETKVLGKCTISGRGTTPGQKGVDMQLDLGRAEINHLTITTTGAVGAAGQPGKAGKNGHKGDCLKYKPGRGKPGGKGGTGGSGGRGGNIVVKIREGSPEPKRLMLDAHGGAGGKGGKGGKGGRGGRGVDCIFWSYPSAKPGNPGPPGDPGPAGEDGTARVIVGRRTLLDDRRSS